mmetsp:Transcript_22783/g.20255  ORF Transcript_22783/g.20255 Transcript_22783/m.20255 type:complete len:254 (+) Transcript_22783:110-871(+)
MLREDWISNINRINCKLLKINEDQKRFYETTKDEYRSYLDLNKHEVGTESTANPTHDDSHDSEAEYMQETTQNRVSRKTKTAVKPKNRFKTFDRLFQRENSKTVTKFQKASKVIKDFCRKEYDNRMFDEIFNAVNHPQTLELKKGEIQQMLISQNQKLKGSFQPFNLNKRTRHQSAIKRNYSAWNVNKTKTSSEKTKSRNASATIRRRFLQSARAERSRMNKLKVNASIMYQQQLSQKRLNSARQRPKPKIKK